MNLRESKVGHVRERREEREGGNDIVLKINY